MTSRTRILILLLRISLGLLLLWTGLQKLSGDFSAAGYLAKNVGPLHDMFAAMAGNALVNFLVVFGEIGVGSALILGIFTRFACLMGGVMMTLYYLSGFPPAHGPIDEHIMYILIFGLLFITAAGRYYGVDKYLEKTNFVNQNFKVLRWILG